MILIWNHIICCPPSDKQRLGQQETRCHLGSNPSIDARQLNFSPLTLLLPALAASDLNNNYVCEDVSVFRQVGFLGCFFFFFLFTLSELATTAAIGNRRGFKVSLRACECV